MRRWFQTAPKPFLIQCKCGAQYSPFAIPGLVRLTDHYRYFPLNYTISAEQFRCEGLKKRFWKDITK